MSVLNKITTHELCSHSVWLQTSVGGGGGLHADQQTTENIVEPGTILRMSFMGNPLHTDQYKVPIVR